jgi:hypothetical protein
MISGAGIDSVWNAGNGEEKDISGIISDINGRAELGSSAHREVNDNAHRVALRELTILDMY